MLKYLLLTRSLYLWSSSKDCSNSSNASMDERGCFMIFSCLVSLFWVSASKFSNASRRRKISFCLPPISINWFKTVFWNSEKMDNTKNILTWPDCLNKKYKEQNNQYFGQINKFWRTWKKVRQIFSRTQTQETNNIRGIINV